MVLIPCLSATRKNSEIRFFKPSESCFQTKYCKNTLTLLYPAFCAYPNSLSIVFKSKVASCHISVEFTAVLGKKLHPFIGLTFLYHFCAFWIDQRPDRFCA